jgi:hypothetical protein
MRVGIYDEVYLGLDPEAAFKTFVTAFFSLIC